MLDNRLSVPIQFFHDEAGDALDSGYVYIGADGQDAESYPQTAYWDEDLSVAVDQPVRTIAGRPDNDGTPATVYVAGPYSIKAKNASGVVIYSVLSVGNGDVVTVIDYDGVDAYPNTLSVGTIVVNETTGARYEVVSSGQGITTSTGMKLKILGEATPEKYGASTTVTDNSDALNAMYASSPESVRYDGFYPVTGNFARADIPHTGAGGVTIGGVDIPLNTVTALADLTFYVDPTGSDTANHGLSSTYPFKTFSRAEKAMPKITFDFQETIELSAGVHDESYTASGDMPRPGIIVPSKRTSRLRTAQSGSTLVGPLVVRGQGATTIVKSNPGDGFNYAVYLTGAQAAFVDFDIEPAASGTTSSLITVQRFAYGHLRNVACDASAGGGVTLSTVVESDGFLEAIDCNFTGAGTFDLLVYAPGSASISGVGSTTQIGNIQNSGNLNLVGDVEVLTSYLGTTASINQSQINGALRPSYAGTMTIDVGAGGTLSSSDISATCVLRGPLRFSGCNFTGTVTAYACVPRLDGCTTTGTAESVPFLVFDDGDFLIDSASQIRDSGGDLTSPNFFTSKVRPAGSSEVIPFFRNGRHSFTDIEILPANSGGLTGMTLSNEISNRYSGTPPCVGDLWTLKVYGVYPYNCTITEGTTGDFGGQSIIIGEQTGASMSATFVWSPRELWMVVSTGDEI